MSFVIESKFSARRLYFYMVKLFVYIPWCNATHNAGPVKCKNKQKRRYNMYKNKQNTR